MSVAFTQESELENRLIDQLTQGESQWTYREDLKDEQSLWSNIREKINRNNRARLDDIPLSDSEFGQVKNQLIFNNPYEAAKWMRGENGIARVSVQRDDASLGTVHLEVMNSREIAGGKSSYEVINQFSADKNDEMDRHRRFDVTLLINGLPMIHIELKSNAISYMQAFRQIKKYQAEGKMHGVYSSVQMFVVTNGTDTRYIAAAIGENLKEIFLTGWVDKNNNPINDYLEFARVVLSIPQAHKMVANYSVIDNATKQILLLRPYQIHAIEAIQDASKRKESGYVWHTTGSGKTLTSYKSAGNLLDIPSVDKSIFIIDRIDLDQQTTNSFEAYAEFDRTEIDSTDNVNDLIKKLRSNDRSVIITTIQKLLHMMRRLDEDSLIRQQITKKRVAFTVDEAHRAVVPVRQQQLNQFFKNNTMWYGFTGTPLFVENARDVMGDMARTTQEQYEQLLHDYTVKEAIHDENVLGFQVQYMRSFDELEMDQVIEQVNPTFDLINSAMIEKEQQLPQSIFTTDEFMWKVVDQIVNRSGNLFAVRKGEGRTYSALLTTTSIAQAQRYYDMFQQVREGTAPIEVREGIRRYLSDFPKVGVTYSISENEMASITNQQQMKQSIQDYNELFQTNFTMDNLAGYNRNLNERLARKASQYRARRSEQLDLVIVVDRLLTGFDAPSLSTLFIDRPPMPPHGMIQAFSRTNRLYESDKKYGQVVILRTPEIWKEKVTEALVLYSNGGENEVLAPTWEESYEQFTEAIEALKEIVPRPDFHIDHLNEADQRKFAKAFQEFDKQFSSIQVYDEFDYEQFVEEFSLDHEVIEEYHGKYQNILENLREEAKEQNIEIDIEYELQSVHISEINYEYIIQLLQSLVPQSAEEPVVELSTEEEESIQAHIDEMKESRPELARLTEGILHEIKEDPRKFQGRDLLQIIQERAYHHQEDVIEEFSEVYGLKKDAFAYYARRFNPQSERPVYFDMRKNLDYEQYKEKTKKPLSRLKLFQGVRKEMESVVTEQIHPYNI